MTPRILTIFTLLLVSSASSLNLNDAVPFSLTLDLASEIVTTGSVVSGSAKLTNDTNQMIEFMATNPVCDYSIEAHRVDGTEAPRTRYGEQAKHCNKEAAGRTIRVRLKPGEEFEDTFEFSMLFDLSEPGGYLFQVSRTIPKVNDKAIVSNSVLLTVMPKPDVSVR